MRSQPDQPQTKALIRKLSFFLGFHVMMPMPLSHWKSRRSKRSKQSKQKYTGIFWCLAMLIHFKFGDVRFNIQPLAACKAHLWTFATSRTNSNSVSQFSCDVSSMKSLIKSNWLSRLIPTSICITLCQHPRLVIWKGVTRKKAPKDTLQLLRRCLEQSHPTGFRVTSLPQPIGKTSKTPSIAEEWGQILSNLGERNSAYKKIWAKEGLFMELKGNCSEIPC